MSKSLPGTSARTHLARESEAARREKLREALVAQLDPLRDEVVRKFAQETVQHLCQTFPGISVEILGLPLDVWLVRWARERVNLEKGFSRSFSSVRRKFLRAWKAATKLREAVSQIDPFDAICLEFSGHKPRDKTGEPKAIQILAEIRSDISALENLLGAVASDRLLAKRGRPQGFWKKLSMRDLIAIFELATGERPTRRIRTPAYSDKAQIYGPFWEFALTCLKPLEGSKATAGLDHLVRTAISDMAKMQLPLGQFSALFIFKYNV